MEQICELNDKIILGQDGLSDKAPRLTARAIVKNQDGLYAVMYSDKFKPSRQSRATAPLYGWPAPTLSGGSAPVGG